MQGDIDRIIIRRDRIAARVREMAGEIGALYRDSEQGPMIVAVLSGAIIFVADLIRHLPMKMKIGLITVSSYHGTESKPAKILQSAHVHVLGRDVLVVDDILDTGQTLRLVLAEIAQRGPASLRTCVLLRKPDRAPADLKPDWVGFDIEDVFVVGYGLDYRGNYRNFPDIAVLKPELCPKAPFGLE
jgi:hypoxanthine phosphoribosyltransferase